MASGLVFTLLLCLSCALWTGTDLLHVVVPPDGVRMANAVSCSLTLKQTGPLLSACIGYDANLASFHSDSEYMYLKSLVYTKKGSYARTWVGGNDAAKDGVWMWSNGSKFNYVSWGSGEPNNTGGREDCMEINLKGAARHLNDEKCTTQNFFICAKNL